MIFSKCQELTFNTDLEGTNIFGTSDTDTATINIDFPLAAGFTTEVTPGLRLAINMTGSYPVTALGTMYYRFEISYDNDTRRILHYHDGTNYQTLTYNTGAINETNPLPGVFIFDIDRDQYSYNIKGYVYQLNGGNTIYAHNTFDQFIDSY